jgi:poly-beta-1,6-N-acetyl-D-glucosamine synthase
MMTRRNSEEHKFAPDFEPTVTILFAAYNEERVIRKKINNHLNLDYPEDKLRIIVATDLCTDRTNEIIEEILPCHKNLTHLRGMARKGKIGTLNNAVPYVKSEVIIFTDANTMFEKNVVRELVKYFSAPQTGLVCGELRLTSPDENIGGKGESLYWRYETLIKKYSGKLGALVGATGGIYAVRTELFEPFPTKSLIMDDFWLAMRIRLRGLKEYYEENAVAYEFSSYSLEDEWQRKVRIGLANYNVIPFLKEALDFRKHTFFAFQYFSHKILRWFAPHMMVLILIFSILGSVKYRVLAVLLGLQLLFYFFSLLGKSIKRLYPCTYFAAIHAALLAGFIKFILADQNISWTPPRR